MASETVGVGGLAERYAVALFELAEEGKVLDKVSKDLVELKAMLNDSEDLARFVSSPLLSREDQGAGMSAVADKAGFDGLTKKFLALTASKRRLFAISAIIRKFQELLAAKNGEITAVVKSAKALTDKQLTDLKAALKGAVGSDVLVEAEVDTSLIGGMVVTVGSRQVDSSIKTKLQRLELAMKGVA